MIETILLSAAQMARISLFFPLSHGMPRVDDRRGIMGVFGRIFVEPAKRGGDTEEIMIKVEPGVRHRSENHWRGHSRRSGRRPACSKGGSFPVYRTHKRRVELKTARGLRQRRSAPHPVSERRPGQGLHGCCGTAVAVATRQGALSQAPQDREHVRQDERLAPHPHPPRPVRPHFHGGNRYRSHRHLLDMINESRASPQDILVKRKCRAYSVYYSPASSDSGSKEMMKLTP